MKAAGIIEGLRENGMVLDEVQRVLHDLELRNQDRVPYMAHAIGLIQDQQSRLLDRLQEELGIAV